MVFPFRAALALLPSSEDNNCFFGAKRKQGKIPEEEVETKGLSRPSIEGKALAPLVAARFRSLSLNCYLPYLRASLLSLFHLPLSISTPLAVRSLTSSTVTGAMLSKGRATPAASPFPPFAAESPATMPTSICVAPSRRRPSPPSTCIAAIRVSGGRSIKKRGSLSRYFARFRYGDADPQGRVSFFRCCRSTEKRRNLFFDLALKRTRSWFFLSSSSSRCSGSVKRRSQAEAMK